MSDLWQTIAELCLELHPDRVDAIVGGIGNIKSVDGLPVTRDRFGPKAGHEFFVKLQAAWLKAGNISPAEVAAGLRSASAAAALKGARGSVELVWSGPSTGVVPVRQTEEVLCEVIEGAHVRLFIVSYVAYKLDRVIRCLDAASNRDVEINVLLESSTESGGKLSFDSTKPLVRRLPKVVFYVWKQVEGAPSNELGAVHAKCAVADSKVAFVTSANLTSAAMDRNMEVGILMKDGHVPEQLNQHFEALIDNGTIVRL
jgi:phosphatidylserine/phosphatidylglycerophosphate/cardiolipin synthase-like enzyme